MKIKEVIVTAYASKGEALEVANNTVEDTVVVACVIIKGTLATTAVCYMVVPAQRPLVKL